MLAAASTDSGLPSPSCRIVTRVAIAVGREVEGDRTADVSALSLSAVTEAGNTTTSTSSAAQRVAPKPFAGLVSLLDGVSGATKENASSQENVSGAAKTTTFPAGRPPRVALKRVQK